MYYSFLDIWLIVMQSNSVHASSMFSSSSSSHVLLLKEVLDRLLPPDMSTTNLPCLVVSWISVTEPSLGMETNFPSSKEWRLIHTELEGMLGFASAMEPHPALIAWCILRDVLARFSSVPFGGLNPGGFRSLPRLYLLPVFLKDRVWFHTLPLWAFALWSARCGTICPSSCRDALQLLYLGTISTVEWLGPVSDVGLPPVLAPLFVTEIFSP